jgi:hypothetical protein
MSLRLVRGGWLPYVLSDLSWEFMSEIAYVCDGEMVY